MPKGCMVDHEWWLRTVDVLLRRIPQSPSDRVLCYLQFFYADPGHLLLECLATGGALVVMRRLSELLRRRARLGPPSGRST
jgi:long-subunit acyl-CoA synthetase (AMP-forming)